MHPEEDELGRETRAWSESVGACFHPLGQDQGSATFTLRQISDRYFSLADGFRFGGDDIGPELLQATDLTSVPQVLRWFVSQYGRHTPAALLHDALLNRVSENDADRLKKWEAADLTFRRALEQLEIPTIRRYLMWAAVSLGSRLRIKGLLPTAGIVVWAFFFVAGTVALFWASFNGLWAVIVATLLGPWVGAGLWGRQYWAGVIAGYGAIFIAPPTVLGMISFWLYRVLEWLVSRLSRARRETHKELPYTGF